MEEEGRQWEYYRGAGGNEGVCEQFSVWSSAGANLHY